MPKEKKSPESTQETDASKENETIAPEPIKTPDGVAVEDAPKTVNVPLSASNALEPDSGILVPTVAHTEEVVMTNPYNPQDTKVQNVLTEEPVDNGKVSQEKYDALLNTFNEVLGNHTIDVVHQQIYKTKAGLI